MSKFLSSLQEKALLGDGALGTMLTQAGLPPGESPELWMLAHPEKLKIIHQAYLKAGAQVIQTNTFGANRLKLQEYQASSQVQAINLTAARLVREVVGRKAFISGIVGPTGHFPAPLGEYTWGQLVEVFREQMEALQKGGADFIFLETFSDLGEVRAALYAAKNFTTLPVACSLTFTQGRTLTGTSPETAAVVLEAMGADLIGANCSTGPQELLPIIEAYSKATNLPLLVEPNAGMPELIDGKTVYRETPAMMASFIEDFLQLGVKFMGACCGSTPEHILAMKEKLNSLPTAKPKNACTKKSFPTRLASRTKVITMGTNELPRLIGERINPTARKSIAQAFRENKWDLILQEAFEQIEKGADLLDLNVGLPGSNEGDLLPEGIRQLQMALDIPLVLDCTDPIALEKGLQEYQGKALINSVNGEEKSLTTILPLAKKYGAAVLGLTLDEKGIPAKAADRFKIAEKIVKRGLEIGLVKEDILMDCLVLTAATDSTLCLETIKTIYLVKKHLGVSCILGLSNVSHGLPQRSWLNNAFLALALGAGLDAAIANPHDSRISETLAAGALLSGRDPGARNYLQVAGKTPPASTKSTDHTNPLSTLHTYILQGQKEPIISLLEELLTTTDTDPLTIIKQGVIPPLEKIGDLFAAGEIFLPQLLLTSEAAKIAFSYLQKQLPAATFANKGTIVLGTVKGDIHDIGKNIVKALLENHGYKIIDLGKNVPTSSFIQTAKKEKAQIIGLSALMTTTMVEMEKVIQEVKKEKLTVKVLVGGAVVTADYARQIGADGYGKDAGETIKVVEKLLASD
ncbi:MAG TPA: dihydropteroate synthase [Clostridia bacterium]|nr:homocysteine S-methyltransferase family protein [Clostridia bacterium]HHY06759.1 dihydropteroate synthase [Clostridia bacterium]